MTFLKVKFWKKNDKFVFYFRPNHINLLLETDKSDQKRMGLWNEDIKHQKSARCWRVSQDLLVKKVIKKNNPWISATKPQAILAQKFDLTDTVSAIRDWKKSSLGDLAGCLSPAPSIDYSTLFCRARLQILKRPLDYFFCFF